MIRVRLVAILTLGSVIACGRSQGVPDEDLGGLVEEPKQADAKIHVDRAAKEPAELGRALAQPYRKVLAALGPHTAALATKTTVEEAGNSMSSLIDTTKIEIGDTGAFRAVYGNDADYGREAIFVGGKLYLRPRYQRWHGRAPETADEPAALRDQFFEPIAATWDLLSPGIELTDKGAADAGGRPGRKIAIQLSPKPSKPAVEVAAQKKWREGRTIEDVSGEVILDAVTGAPLAVQLAGTVSFMRDGRRFKMKTSLTATLSELGTPVAITAPAEGDVVATPERRREVDERDYLLQGIAPPIRKNADGTAATPQSAQPKAPTP
ncbi:MAG: hypothetical protein H0T42_25520 [Deltaproteobacteria bacterium]|nr:hypothetical protein [Deltaproteobacteria bacterium]